MLHPYLGIHNEYSNKTSHRTTRKQRALAAGFKHTAEHLTRHPFIGRRGDLEGTRELMLHRNYLLTYRVSSEAVEILQIWQVAQKRFH